MSNKQFERICRTCLMENDSMVKISEFLNDSFPFKISSVIHELAAINIEPEDKFPQNICVDCVQKSEQAFKFKRMCESSNTYLYELQMVKTEVIVPELIQVPESEQDELVDENVIDDKEDDINQTDFDNLVEYAQILNNKHNTVPDEEEAELIKAAKPVNGRLQCPICPRSLSNSKILKLHIRSHLGRNLLHCNVCNKGFAKGSNLNRHVLLHQSVDILEEERIIENAAHSGRFICPYCSKILIDRQSFKLHIRKHISKMVKCKTNESDEILKMHMGTHNKLGEINVKEVLHHTPPNPSGDDDDEILLKKCLAKDGRFECIFCKKLLANRQTLKYHIRLHVGKNLFICEHCNSGFSKKSHLKRHIFTHIKRNHPCKFCDSVFNTHQERNIHTSASHKSVVQKQSESVENNIEIDLKLDQLNVHRKSHLPREKKFACDICEKCFSRTDNLRVHMRVHLPPEKRPVAIKKHLCSYCGRSFSNSSNLTVHIRRHTGERPYRCEFCEASFPRTSDLQCHRRTHTGEKTCICNVCGKGFTRSNKLVRHMRVHTGERPYKCPHCDRAFTQSNDLTLHIRRHSGLKPFACNCGDRFITNSLLQQHRRSMNHLEDSCQTVAAPQINKNSVNNPHRLFNSNDGKQTGITATLSCIKRKE